MAVIFESFGSNPGFDSNGCAHCLLLVSGDVVAKPRVIDVFESEVSFKFHDTSASLARNGHAKIAACDTDPLP